MDYKINTGFHSRRVSITSRSPLSSIIRGLFPELSTRHLRIALLTLACIPWSACHARHVDNSVVAPSIDFTEVPLAAAGNAQKLSPIRGRVTGEHSGQQVVLYARAGNTWWVQPFTNLPFTKIQPNSKWSNSTHPGVDYAALLVGADFQPPFKTNVLPTAGVAAVAIIHGEPVFWQRWWFPFVCVIAGVLAIFGYHRLRLHKATRKLRLSFEERLAERMRVAQELHDTFLQGVLSASMQLHVAVDQMPAESPSRPALDHVIQLMEQVAEEGRNTLQGMRSSIGSAHDLEHSFLKIPQELSIPRDIRFRIIVEGPPVPLQPAVRNDVYRIGREALVNAFRHSRASNIELELEYAVNQLRLLVRDNGRGIGPEALRSGRNGHSGLSGMRERAERIGGTLKVSSGGTCGTEVELNVPSPLAFESYRLSRTSKWFTVLRSRDKSESAPETGERVIK